MKSRASSAAELRALLRELSAELGQINHRVGLRAQLRDADLAYLDLLARKGPQSPTALARAMQVHPATTTGVLDRLEAEGWIARERDPADRRGVLIRLLPGRVPGLMARFAGMNGAIGRIAEGYDTKEIAVIRDFLTRLIEACRAANQELAEP
jgi:DNA-binding MarR family transcriptional regulator